MTPSLLPHPPSISAHVRLLTGYFDLCDNLLFFTLPSNVDLLIDALCTMFQPETSAPIATAGGKGTVAFKNSSGFYLPRFRYLGNDDLVDTCNRFVHVVARCLAKDCVIDGVVDGLLQRLEEWDGRGENNRDGGAGVVLTELFNGLNTAHNPLAWSVATRTINCKGWKCATCFEELEMEESEVGEEDFESWMDRTRKGRKGRKRRKATR